MGKSKKPAIKCSKESKEDSSVAENELGYPSP